jgi:uncharacterized protein YndB with AHSA1/START domain
MSNNSTQVYHVFIRATAEDIWQAITSPERTAQYFYGTAIEVTPETVTSRGSDGAITSTEAVLEFDPPRRLVQEWRSEYDPDLAGEPASRVDEDAARDRHGPAVGGLSGAACPRVDPVPG